MKFLIRGQQAVPSADAIKGSRCLHLKTWRTRVTNVGDALAIKCIVSVDIEEANCISSLTSRVAGEWRRKELKDWVSRGVNSVRFRSAGSSK